MSAIVELLKQPSTWKGIIIVLSLIGINLDPDQLGGILQAAAALYAAIAIVWQKS